MPWTNKSCRKIVSYPSQVISVYVEGKVAHVTIDSGATVSFIIESEAKRLNLKIEKASQLARQADGDTMMHVMGEIHGKMTRGEVTFEIHALVVPKLDDAQFLAGMNFLIENKVSQEPYKHRIVVDNKYTIEETPATFVYPPETPHSKTVKIKKLKTVHIDQPFEILLPIDFPPNSKVIVDSSDQANPNQGWLFQEVEAVNRTLKITNDSKQVKLLGNNGDASVLKLRPIIGFQETLKDQNTSAETSVNLNQFLRKENTKIYVSKLNSSFQKLKPLPKDLYIPKKRDPKEYLSQIYIEPGVMTKEQSEKLWEILLKYHKVFDEDISEGYNNASGEFDVNWNWLNDQKPPPGVSRQEVSNNEEMNQIKQDKIDWMESQNICFKAHLLGAPVKYASLTMLVPKASIRKHEGPLNHNLFRFVNLFNQLNEYIALEPSQPESINDVLYDAGQWEFMISGDLSNSFYQRWICKEKLPYMAFHSPYKGMYILARSAQGMKNQSEGLDQMMRVILGDLIKEGKAKKIADDVQAGGNSVDEAIDNFAQVLAEFDKNNIKMAPKKTRIFAKKLPIFGFIKEGNMLKPDQHSILAIEKSEKPNTVTELRSYLGQYRVFFKHMENMSAILEPMEKLTGEKDGKKRIEWTDSLNESFENSKIALKNIEPLYLPKKSDRLAITLDWSKSGVGATLFALLKDKKLVVAYFSSPLTANQSKWPPCDGEGLAACMAVDRFSLYIRESIYPTLVCSDSKPVVQAAQLLMKGFFSSSQRLNRLLNNCNTFPIDFHHLSGKLSLNEESDLLSRNPNVCKEVNCPVCSFLVETDETLDKSPTALRNTTKVATKHVSIDDSFINQKACRPECHTCAFLLTTKPNFLKTFIENFQTSNRKMEIEPEEILDGSKPFPFIGNRKLLIQIQKRDPVLLKLSENLQSGHRPTNRNTKSNDLKTYLSFKPKLEPDGLVVIDRVIQPYLHKLTVPVLPPSFARSVMLAAHIKMDHPKAAQFEKLIFRSFCTLKIRNLIKDLIDNCFTCQADLNLPQGTPEFNTETKPNHPGSHWSCDILKHGGKNIMVSTDNFSSFTITKMIPSENQFDCENAIISSVFPFRAATGGTTIRVDTAPGISAIINKNSEGFRNAEIKLEPGDVKNKNSCAKVDKTMAELRSILRTISPDGSPLSELDLQRATETLNMRIRNMNLSAREIMFSRLQNNNENIKLDDKILSDTQYENRKKANNAAAKMKPFMKASKDKGDIDIHSLVFIKHDVAKDKSKLRDLYIVTDMEEDSKISIQKVLHPFTNKKGEINNRRKYRVKIDDVYLAPNQPKTKLSSQHEDDAIDDEDQMNKDNNQIRNVFNKQPRDPGYVMDIIQKQTKFYSLSHEDSDDENDIFGDPPIEEGIHKRIYTDNVDNAIAFTESEGPPLKPRTTYRRLRSNTFPRRSAKHSKPHLCPINVHQRWLRSRSKPPDIDAAPTVGSPVVEFIAAVDDDFGTIPSISELSWDHDTDLYSPEYDEEEELSRLANEVALTAIDEQDDEVFEDSHTFPPEVPMMEEGNRLELIGDTIQQGRVYRLSNRLADQNLLLSESNKADQMYRLDNRVAVNTDKIVIKQKRLVGSSSSSTKGLTDEKEKNVKRKKRSKIRWFIKKFTFAKKPPEDDDKDPTPEMT